MVAGKLFVLPMRPGEGTPSILLVGNMTGDRSPEEVWANPSAAAASKKKRQMPGFAGNDTGRGYWYERVTTPPRKTGVQKRKRVERNRRQGAQSKATRNHHRYKPEALEVGRSDSGLSESSGCTLCRTSAPCTQKITSSAILVAWSATRSRLRATSSASSACRTTSGRSFIALTS